jgi:hypothetical protein
MEAVGWVSLPAEPIENLWVQAGLEVVEHVESLPPAIKDLVAGCVLAWCEAVTERDGPPKPRAIGVPGLRFVIRGAG